MPVVILAGGEGKRLASCTKGLPKPLVEILGKSVLERQVEWARANGVTDIWILTGYRAEAIERFCGDGSRWGIRLRCIAEERPRGTAGAVLAALQELPERFAVLYGDTILNVDLTRLVDAHKRSGAAATLFVHLNDHPHDSDLVEVDHEGRIVAFGAHPRPRNASVSNLVNAGLYIIERKALQHIHIDAQPLDFVKHAFPVLLREGMLLCGYRSPEYVRDVGTPERLAQVADDLAAGLIARSSADRSLRAIFLDRDGTLIDDVPHLHCCEELRVLPGVCEGLRRLRAAGYRLAIITNQPVVARGECSEQALARIHDRLRSELRARGALVDAIYYCPHHPDSGFAGEILELKAECDCRKPKTGLITRACADLGIDLADSWFVGDSTVDVTTAVNAGLRSILLDTGQRGRDRRYPVEPDFRCRDLLRAAQFIVDLYPALLAEATRTADRVQPGMLILVGGQASAGKSTFASVLRLALRNRGKPCAVVALDGWIRGVGERVEGLGLWGRHDLADAVRTVISMRGQPGVYDLPRYDRQTRQRLSPTRVHIAAEDIIVAEGVTALVNPELTARSDLRIFVACDEAARRRRMAEDYLSRGFSESAVTELIHGRLEDEYHVVQRGESIADIRVEVRWP